jgi:hypothetical protein
MAYRVNFHLVRITPMAPLSYMSLTAFWIPEIRVSPGRSAAFETSGVLGGEQSCGFSCH